VLRVLEVLDDEEKVEVELVLLAGAIIPIAKYPPTAATMTTTANTAMTAFPMARRLRFEPSKIITVKLPRWKVAFDYRELCVEY
jgi:hypothetical protein